MPQVVFPMDNTKKFTEQKIVGHNRWHPDIPARKHQARRSLPRGFPRVVRRCHSQR